MQSFHRATPDWANRTWTEGAEAMGKPSIERAEEARGRFTPLTRRMGLSLLTSRAARASLFVVFFVPHCFT